MSTMTRGQQARFIRRAADTIAQGWTQGAMEKNHGRQVCTLGGLNVAVCGAAIPTMHAVGLADAVEDLAYVIRDVLHLTPHADHSAAGAIAQWNDEVGRTQAEVVAALTLVADLLDAEEARDRSATDGDQLPLTVTDSLRTFAQRPVVAS